MSRSRRRQDKIAVAAIVIGAVAMIVALVNIVASRSDESPTVRPSATAAPTDDSSQNDLESNGDDSDETTPSTTRDWSEMEAALAGTTSSAGRHTITMRIETDSLSQWAYKWRDRGLSDKKVTRSGQPVTRTLVTPLPGGVIAVQLGPGGGTASCSVTVDGVETSSQTATGRYSIAICGG